MITIDMSVFLQKMDEMIGLLKDIHKVMCPQQSIQEEKPNEQTKPEEPFEEEITFINDDVKDYQCPDGWVSCKINPQYEIEIKRMHMIRHKITKEKCEIRFDQRLYPYPYFENSVFHMENPPLRYHRIVALQFIDNPNHHKYALPKNGNKFDWGKDNIIWTDKKPKTKKIQLNEDIVKDKTFEHIGESFQNENFNKRQLVKYGGSIYQEYDDNNAMYIEAPKVDDEWIVINDDNEFVGIS
ncbi:MAG: hypothetical protein LBR15_00655 [Methanobrevibacter sp.]|jgi:hypothetical protein|nr:hypothetical protein [Candidatus Methanovirga australis]